MQIVLVENSHYLTRSIRGPLFALLKSGLNNSENSPGRAARNTYPQFGDSPHDGANSMGPCIYEEKSSPHLNFQTGYKYAGLFL